MKQIYTILCLCLTLAVYADSPYIYRVFEYTPAPGQFVNLLPEYEQGDDINMMRLKAEEAIADNNMGMISLGGWGGYVVFGFDHEVKNVQGAADFIIYGNAFYAETNPNTDAPAGGSSEPGVIWVSYDSNGNGRPDDEWYEIAGSEYNNKETVKNYSLTYYRPATDHVATPSKTNKNLIDTTFIRYEDNQGGSGYINKLVYHTQSYFPLWTDDDEMTFTGTRLPNNGKDESGNGSYYVLYAFDYGYADNHPNTSDKARIDISWAVDADGNPANLQGIHFVKVCTGEHQQCGWIGETSTEILGAEDLNMPTSLTATQKGNSKQQVYTVTGVLIGENMPVEKGLYIVKTGNKAQKIIIK